MTCMFVFICIFFAASTQGVFDDAHVEQYQSPFVEARDPGTHMTNRHTRGQQFQSIGVKSSPYSSSSRQEFHEEQRYVNGQPVFEKKQQRRYENGQLIYEDGFEKGRRELAAAGHASGGYAGGTVGSGYRESSQSSYSSSTGLVEGQNSQLGEASSGYDDHFRSDIERLRQRLHAGTGLPQGPSGTISTSSYKDESNQEAHFVNGQQVYHKNQERRFQDGKLVHDELDERGNRNVIGGEIPSLQGSQTSSQSSHSSSSYAASTDGQEQYPPSGTAYRPSYSRREPLSRQTSSTTRRVISSAVQPNAQGTSAGYVRTSHRTPYQSSYQAGTNRRRERIENSRPAYRASYTPSNSVVRVPQNPSLTSAPSSTSSSTQRHSSSSYQSKGTYVTHSTPTYNTDNSNQAGRYETSYSNKPEISYNQQSGYQPRVIYRPGSQVSSSDRTNYVATYGAGSYSRSTESPNSGTTSRITDTHSEPYSVRSPSYQPGRFSSYSAWSHWNEESDQPSQVHSSGLSSSQSQYQARNEEQNTERTFQSSNTRSGSSHDSQAGIRNEGVYSGGLYNSQSEYGRGSTYSGNFDHPQQEREGSSHSENAYNSQSGVTASNTYSGSPYDNQEESGRENTYSGSSYNSQQVNTHSLSPGFLYGEHESSVTSSDSDNSINYSSSSTSESENARVAVGAGPSQTFGLSLAVDVGEGDSVRVSPNGIQSPENQDDRYDINPLVDGGSQNVVRESGSRSSSSVIHMGASGSQGSQYGSNEAVSGSSTSFRGSSISETSQSSRGAASGTRYIPSVYPSGSAYGSTRVTNKTTNTITSHIQPLISSYKLETRTSRRYLNGQLVSETKFNRYFENGELVHENQTVRSRDEMETDGVDVTALDLTLQDLEKYRIAESGAIPMSHSQRYEMTQEKEFVDGSQTYESTLEKHFQDGKLIHEEHDEKDQSQLEAAGRGSLSNINSARIQSSQRRITDYQPQIETNRAYERNSESSYSRGTVSNAGSRQFAGESEGIMVSVSPRTTTRKTEIRREQEFKDGQQVYDLRHEKKYEGGSLIHEDYVEKGPDELGTGEHRDALRDILSGRTLNTASQSRYESSSNQLGGGQYGSGSYDTGSSVTSQSTSETSLGARYDSSSGYNSEDFSSSGAEENERSQNMIGSNLLSSGSLTSIIGGGSVEKFNSLHEVNQQSQGSSGTDKSDERRYGGGYYTTISGGSGSGYGGATYNSRSETERRSQVAERQQESGGRYGGTAAYGSFSAESNPGQSHRREMEVEEHYRDGSLVKGREQELEWKNDQLLRHDVRHYGENDGQGRLSGSAQIPSQSAASSSYQSSSQSASSSYDSSGGQQGQYGARIGTYGIQTGSQNAQIGSQGARTQLLGSQTGAYGAHGGLYNAQTGSYEAQSGSSESVISHAGSGGAGGYGAISGSGASHRQEMEFEEHYENGQLVRGRKENKEWENDELVRHDEKVYGEGRSSDSSLFSNSLTGACSNSPCQNGGSCITGARGYLCVCPFGFRGLRCDEAYCPTRYCRNDGVCETDGDGTHRCSCPLHYTGPRCERRGRDRGVN